MSTQEGNLPWVKMSNIMDSTKEQLQSMDVWPYLKASLRSRTSVWIGVAAIVGWLLSRVPAKRRRTYGGGSDQGEKHHSWEITPAAKTKHPKGRGGLLSLAIELLGAVAISIVQRYAKSWSSRLLVTLKNSPQNRSSFGDVPSKTAPKDFDLHDQQSEIPPEKLEADKAYPKGIVALFKNTAREWIEDKCPQLGAALAYFTVFSLAPLVLVLLAVFGLIFGSSDQAREKITEQLQYLIDPSGIKVIQDIAANASKPQAGIIATTIGVVLALFGASGVFGQLQDALNTIWGVKPKPGGGVMGFIRTRFLSFAMVGGVCFLLLVSLTVEILLRGFSAYLKNVMPGGDILALTLFLLFDVAVVISLFAMIFRYLPDAKIAWRDVWIGATLTAVLFALGKFILGLYLGSGAAGSAYGAASSLITLLLWIYYAAQILLFGAEFTQVYANTYGTHVEPQEHAVKVERKEIEVPSRQG
jgi:membrane protein